MRNPSDDDLGRYETEVSKDFPFHEKQDIEVSVRKEASMDLKCKVKTMRLSENIHRVDQEGVKE